MGPPSHSIGSHHFFASFSRPAAFPLSLTCQCESAMEDKHHRQLQPSNGGIPKRRNSICTTRFETMVASTFCICNNLYTTVLRNNQPIDTNGHNECNDFMSKELQWSKYIPSALDVRQHVRCMFIFPSPSGVIVYCLILSKIEHSTFPLCFVVSVPTSSIL